MKINALKPQISITVFHLVNELGRKIQIATLITLIQRFPPDRCCFLFSGMRYSGESSKMGP